MLTAAPKDVPLREHSHLDLRQQQNYNQQESLSLEDRLCPGCKKSAVNEQGGLVVAFGQSFFHVDCFKCAKCRNQVTADTNLLLLSDGSPICSDCSYSCNICRQPILDEAIMTGDDSYHAHCFKCKVCSNRIDELVFAKTSQGIYCMNCHNERMIKIRKHAQKKAERAANGGGSGSSRTKESDARNYHREPRPTSSKPLNGSSSQRRDDPRPLEVQRSPSRPSFDSQTRPSDFHPSQSGLSNTGASPPVAITPPTDSTPGHQHPQKSSTLPIPSVTGAPETKRRGSDALRPSSNGTNLTADSGLSVTSRRDKRRSINPGLSLSPLKDFATLNHALSNGSSQQHDPRASPTSPFLTPSENLPFTSSGATSRSRSNSAASGHEINVKSIDDTVIQSSPPNMTIDLGRSREPSVLNHSRFSNTSMNSGTLSPIDAIGFNFSKRSSNSSNFDRQRSGTPSRASSPAHHADVPEGIESGPDTDSEHDTDRTFGPQRVLTPPVPPPKDASKRVQRTSSTSSYILDADASELSPGADILEESTAIEQTSHTTYIAPALPPIRFSMNNADFSELLSSVNGLPPLKSLDSLSKLSQTPESNLPSTPPPSAASWTELQAQTPRNPAKTSETLSNPIMTLTPSDDTEVSAVNADSNLDTNKPQTLRMTESVAVIGRLREAVQSAKDRGARQLQVDLNLVDHVIELLESRDAAFGQLKTKVDGMNRESKRYIAGLTVAQAEYDQELKARRDAEAEVTRLRVLLSGQAVRLAALSGDNRKQELRQQMSKDLNDNLSGLEHDLSRLKVERDVTLAEVEELSAKKSNGSAPDAAPANLSRSLTKRLENIRVQYQRELVPLTDQKGALQREIAELKSVREMFLEETTVLNARNEELAQLSAVYARRLENSTEPHMKPLPEAISRASSDTTRNYPGSLVVPSLSASTSSSSTAYEDQSEHRQLRAPLSQPELHTPAKNKFKWPGSKTRDSPAHSDSYKKPLPPLEHNFQQLSILRFARCDHCGDKMWGSQLRCTSCSASIHVRCIAHVTSACNQGHTSSRDESEALPPSMFGRDLTEQVHADSRDYEREVPVIVEKCIQAVEVRALDYEGIYRKTGGSSQSKAITQLFERGDYDSFDLADGDRFTDICSITSVLKTYFRSLPVPLLTFDMHDQFVAAATIREPALKQSSLSDLVNLLPREHYFTLRMLMIHLHHVCAGADVNLMTARNLGVVFGPTLLRSRDPGAEFSDMAGKALFVEWLVENAPSVFSVQD